MHSIIKYYHSILYHSKSIHRIWCSALPSIWRQDRKSTAKHNEKTTTTIESCSACVCSVVCSDNCPYHILYFWLDNIDRQLNRQLTHIHALHRILINWMQSKINFPMINTERESSEQTPNKRIICKLESSNYNNNRLVFPDKFQQICSASVYFRFMCFLFIFPSNRESFWIA